MSNLVEELKKEHALIVEILNKVKDLGINSEEGQKMFISAKNGLLAHIKKEDELFYPLLYKAAESDADLKRTLDTFAKDMEVISKAVLEFFEKYSNGGSGLEFAKDFGKIYSKLSQRIFKEENIIYKKYNELEK